MKSIKIKLLQEGMVTASEVKDRLGRTLLTSGQTITANNLKTLKAWGITDVNIEDSNKSKDNLSAVDEVEVKASPVIIKEQEILFKYSDQRHPAVAELYSVCLSRKVQLSLEDK